MEIFELPIGYKNLVGNRFNYLTIIKFKYIKNKTSYWICKCDCGKEKIIKGSSVITNITKSCGCLKSENAKTHGDTKTSEYISWKSMKARCFNPNIKQYKNYGGRGITVCDEWKNSFIHFIKDMGNKPAKNYSIDRVNVNGNYCKENCRWSDSKTQNRNKNNNIKVTYKGVTKLLIEFCEELNLKYSLMLYRISRFNWKVEDAFEKP